MGRLQLNQKPSNTTSISPMLRVALKVVAALASFAGVSYLLVLITGKSINAVQSNNEHGAFYALNFDGTDDYVAIDNFSYASTGLREVTVEAWIRTTASGDQIIASYDRSEYWRLEINGTGGGAGQIGWCINTNAGILDFGSTTRVDDGNWHHVAGTFNNGTAKIYIDGILDATATKGSTFGSGATRYGFIGVGSEANTFDGSKGPSTYFEGDMDELRVYNAALTQSEIRDRMCRKLSGSESGLQMYYQFSDTSGTSLSDKKGNAPGTLRNFALNGQVSNWVISGAPVGDISAHSYAGVLKVSLTHPDGDKFTVDNLQGGAQALQVYLVQSSPLVKNVPYGFISIDTSRYWGVFIIGGTSTSYDVVYDYAGNVYATTSEVQNSLLSRSNAASIWYADACGQETLNINSDKLSKSGANNKEYTISKTDPGSAFSNGMPGPGYTLEFDGVDDYIALNSYFNTSGQLPQLTVEAWVKTTVSGQGTNDNWAIIDYDRSEYFNLFVEGNNGTVGFATTDNAANIHDLYSSVPVNDGLWHHIAGVYDGTNKIIYVDGVESGRANNAHNGRALGTGNVRYGIMGDGSEASTINGSRNNFYYKGAMDEVRVWNLARTVGEIRDKLCEKLKRTESGLVNYFRFDEGSGYTVKDLACNSNYGTLMNGLSSSWTLSGAAVGDTSIETYSSNVLSFFMPDSAVLGAVVNTGIYNSIHIYYSAQQPLLKNLVSGCVGYAPTYYGIYIPGQNVRYVMTYNYAHTSFVNGRPGFLLGERASSALSWAGLSGAHNAVSMVFTKNMNITGQWGNEYILGETSASALPVKLLNFDAVFKDDVVELNWTTLSEINNDHFTIERSKDGVTYEQVVTVEGAGNSTVKIDYDAVDNSPLKGTSYYRLKQIDLDGQYEYFGPVAVKNTGVVKEDDLQLKLYPNPAQGEPVIVELKGVEEGESISLLIMSNNKGLVHEEYAVAEGDKLNFTLNISEYASGTYLVICRTTTKSTSKQLVILK